MRAERWMALRAHRRLLALVGHTGIVSFSFDDACKARVRTEQQFLKNTIAMALGMWLARY